MRRLLALLALCCAGAAAQGFAFVQANVASANVTFVSPVTAGDLLVMCGSVVSAAATITAVSDTLGNTWVDSGHVSTNNPSLNERGDCWYALASVASGTDSIIVSRSGGAAGSTAGLEFSYAGTIALDTGNVGEGDSSVPSVSLTTAASGELLLGYVVSTSALDAGSGFTRATAGATNWNELSEYDTASASGSQDVPWGSSASHWSQAAIAFKAAGTPATMVPRHH